MKYEAPEFPSDVVAEHIVYASTEAVRPHNCINSAHAEESHNVFDVEDAPCQFSVEEAMDLIHQAEDDYRNGRIHTTAAVSDLLRNLAR